MNAERQQKEPQKAEPIQLKQEKAKLSFVDNRPIVAVQAKMIKRINEPGVIQGYWGVPIRNRNGDLMAWEDFQQHQSLAGAYFDAAIRRRNLLNTKDRENGKWIPLTVACHDTAFGVCGKEHHANSRHAEIQILDDCPDQDCFEIGITQDMCNGEYGPPSCQATVTDNYNAKKAIFAKVPYRLYIFPNDNTNRTEVSEKDKKEVCDNCRSRFVTVNNLCGDCLLRDAEEYSMGQVFSIMRELKEAERQQTVTGNMEEYSEPPTYEHVCKECKTLYESYCDNESDLGWCRDCMRTEMFY